MYIYIANYKLEKKIDFSLNIDFLLDYAYNNREEYSVLGTIDPYGKTFFNNIQINYLILDEIKNISKFIPEKTKETCAFIDFIKTVEQHNFLVVVGD